MPETLFLHASQTSLRVSGIPLRKPSDVTTVFPRQRQAAGISFWSLWSHVGEPCAAHTFSTFSPFPGAALLNQPWIHINGATVAFSLALCLKKTRRHFTRPAYYGVRAQNKTAWLFHSSVCEPRLRQRGPKNIFGQYLGIFIFYRGSPVRT